MIRAGILTASETRSRGDAIDRATTPLRELLIEHGLEVTCCLLVPDELMAIHDGIVQLVEVDEVCLVLTTGGTGLGPRDVTPEATRLAIEREVPGIAELLRSESARSTPHAWLSRAVAGTRGHALVVNLPGSPDGALECARLVLPLVEHVAAIMRGASHDTSPPWPRNSERPR